MSWHIYVTSAPLSPAPFRSFLPPLSFTFSLRENLKKNQDPEIFLFTVFFVFLRQ